MPCAVYYYHRLIESEHKLKKHCQASRVGVLNIRINGARCNLLDLLRPCFSSLFSILFQFNLWLFYYYLLFVLLALRLLLLVLVSTADDKFEDGEKFSKTYMINEDQYTSIIIDVLIWQMDGQLK